MTNKNVHIVSFGEVLWDVFPEASLLGGAPLNVAMRLHTQGAEVTMLSTVGDDDLGHRALAEIQTQGLSTTGISVSAYKPTGQVLVSLSDGVAQYSILEDVAWDHITIPSVMIPKIKQADALIFGSLALRKKHNLQTLNELLEYSNFSIFDLNLRPPFYSDTLILDLMRKADLVKMNDEELVHVCRLLDIHTDDLQEQVLTIAEKTATRNICVTLGDQGAVLLYGKEFVTHPGYKVKVADTVGAGDSFFAGLIYHLLCGSNTETALDTACAIGALVASKKGANCEVTSREITHLQRGA
ncbi:MAG: carbohydrate kinase [Flavobacterium sp.]|nr:MAG: carbohydrate kinase [Flavobacterium sp.]